MTDPSAAERTESDFGRIAVCRRELLAVGGVGLGITAAGCFADDDDESTDETETATDNPGEEASDGEFSDPDWFEIGEIYHAGDEYDTDRVEVINTHEDRPLDITRWTFETGVMSVTVPDEAVLDPGQTGFVELGDGEDNALDPDGGVLTVLTDEGELRTEVEYPPAPTEADEDEPEDQEEEPEAEPEEGQDPEEETEEEQDPEQEEQPEEQEEPEEDQDSDEEQAGEEEETQDEEQDPEQEEPEEGQDPEEETEEDEDPEEEQPEEEQAEEEDNPEQEGTEEEEEEENTALNRLL